MAAYLIEREEKMSKIDVTHIDLLDISQMTNTQVAVSGGKMTLAPLPSDESEYEKGMRRAMQKIAASCGRVFGADVGYEDLPDLVESIVRIKKGTAKPTKFVKVEESIFDLKGEFERGELYCKNLCASDDYTRLNTEVALFGCAAAGNIYRQVEIDWRDEVKKLDKSAIFHDSGDLFLIIDSNSNDFISMCHEIASLTEKPTN